MKGFGLYLIFKARVFETRKWPFCSGLGGARNLKTSGGTLTFVALILWHILVSSEKNSPRTRRDKQTECNGSQSGKSRQWNGISILGRYPRCLLQSV